MQRSDSPVYIARMNGRKNRSDRWDMISWRRASLDAACITLFILGVFYSWFAVANRSVIFLYDHVAPGIPKTEPFDAITSSRYWMAGLVVTGAVMVVYTMLYWVLGQIGRWRKMNVTPPLWKRVWMLCALPLVLGILLITMSVNMPTLPWRLALACLIVTLVGLAFALWPAAWAAKRPLDLLWLGADGVALLPILLLLRAVELPSRGISISPPIAVLVAISSLVVGIAWFWLMTRLRIVRHRAQPTSLELLASAIGSTYLLLPLLHYLLGKAEYRYITAASNFFAFSYTLQLLIFLLSAVVAVGVTAIRRKSPVWTREPLA